MQSWTSWSVHTVHSRGAHTLQFYSPAIDLAWARTCQNLDENWVYANIRIFTLNLLSFIYWESSPIMIFYQSDSDFLTWNFLYYPNSEPISQCFFYQFFNLSHTHKDSIWLITEKQRHKPSSRSRLCSGSSRCRPQPGREPSTAKVGSLCSGDRTSMNIWN